MSRRAEKYRKAEEDLSHSMKEFGAEWDKLRKNVDTFINAINTGEDPEDPGIVVKLSCYRLSFLSAEIIVFLKRISHS
jgi:hypothetical protein